MPEPLEELRKIRREKLKKIRALGIDPYPSKYEGRMRISVVREKTPDSQVKAAGRLVSWRSHGRLVFADLEDESGKIQLAFRSADLAAINRKLLALLDVGDFLGVEGRLFRTRVGELTVAVSNFSLLTKSLRPLPSRWHGLKAVEARYRRRYLDLLMNPKVKEVFKIRSRVVTALRDFLINKKGYTEVETPVLQPLYGGGLARPFKTYHNALGIPLYLRISTELYLKRLIAGGFEKVFELNKVFRNEGVDRNHNPEFTILETMEAYADFEDNMDLTEEMFEYVTRQVAGTTEVSYRGQKINFKRPWERLTMVAAIKKITGKDFSSVRDLKKAREMAKGLGVELAEFHNSVGMVIAAVFDEKVESKIIQPTFIYEFPVEVSPLAKKCARNPAFVERFEHLIAGMEMSNNYSELNDPLDLAERFKDERKKERLGDEEAHQTDNDFIEAMEYGMPPTSGIGPGIDRYVMILADAPSMREVILFPTLRPETSSSREVKKKWRE